MLSNKLIGFNLILTNDVEDIALLFFFFFKETMSF